MTSEKVKLFCILDGDSTAFPVKVATDESVGELKTAIKSENKNLFNDVDARELTLWHVSISIGGDNEEDDNEEEDDKPILLKDHLADAKRIRAKQAATDICEIFGTAPPKNTIHVIVQRPAAAS
ncbi:hypothetical protein BGZ46_005489, partial [Entomortierella lignicola]